MTEDRVVLPEGLGVIATSAIGMGEYFTTTEIQARALRRFTMTGWAM